MKKILLPLLFIALLGSTSCLSTIVSQAAKSSKVNNKMVLHSNPRVGDYAILKGSAGNTQMKLEIVKISHGLYVVRSETGVGMTGVGFMASLVVELHVTRSGIVKKAFVVEGTQYTPIQIARKGDPEYMTVVRLTSSEKRELDVPSRITVPAGTYSVSSVAFKSQKNDTEQRTVNLTSSRVKFGMVASYVYVKNSDGSFSRHQGFELAEQGRK